MRNSSLGSEIAQHPEQCSDNIWKASCCCWWFWLAASDKARFRSPAGYPEDVFLLCMSRHWQNHSFKLESVWHTKMSRGDICNLPQQPEAQRKKAISRYLNCVWLSMQ